MTNSTVFNIFDGRYSAIDKVRQRKKYVEIESEIEIVINKIVKEKDEKVKKQLLSELNLLYGELEHEASSGCYDEGFKIGLKLGADVFLDSD